MSQHHPSQIQYQLAGFSGHASQGCQQNFQPVWLSSYMPQYSFQVPFTSNVFYDLSQMFPTTLNTTPSAYNLTPLTSCYRSSLSTQMCDMGHEDEEGDDDNNNNNDDDDDGDDDDNGGHHVPQQQHTITHEHPRPR